MSPLPGESLSSMPNTNDNLCVIIVNRPDGKKNDVIAQTIRQRKSMRFSKNVHSASFDFLRIGVAGVSLVADALKHPNQIYALTLTQNDLSNDGAIAFCDQVLIPNLVPHLKLLNLSDNLIGEEGLTAIFRAVRNHPQLQYLLLGGNIVTEAHVGEIKELLECNKTLVQIQLDSSQTATKAMDSEVEAKLKEISQADPRLLLSYSAPQDFPDDPEGDPVQQLIAAAKARDYDGLTLQCHLLSQERIPFPSMAAIAEATTDKPHTNEEKNNIFGIYLNLIELNVNACRDAIEKDKGSLEATTKMIAHQEETLMDLGKREQNIEAEIEKQKKLLEFTRTEKEMQEKQFVLFKELRVSTTADLEQKGIALEQLVQNRLSAESESVECNRNCELVRRLPKEKKFQKLTEAEIRLVLLEAGLGRTDPRLKGWVGQTLTVKLERDPMRLKSALDLTVVEMAKMRHTIFLWDNYGCLKPLRHSPSNWASSTLVVNLRELGNKEILMGLSEELLVKVETMSITGDVFMFLRSGDFEELGFDCAEATTLEEAALYIFQSYKALTVKGGDVLVSHPEERIWESPEPPHAFLCIITLNVMTDPVKASDGQVYERKAIEKWMETSKYSPYDRSLLTPELIPQDFLRAAIQQERAKRLEALHNGEKLEETSSEIPIPAPTGSTQTPEEKKGKGKEKEEDEDFVETLF